MCYRVTQFVIVIKESALKKLGMHRILKNTIDELKKQYEAHNLKVSIVDYRNSTSRGIADHLKFEDPDVLIVVMENE